MFSASVLLAIVAVVVIQGQDPDEVILILTTSNNDVAISSATNSPVTLTLMNMEDNLVYKCDVTPQNMDASYSCIASAVGEWCPEFISAPSPLFYVQNPSDDDIHVSALAAFMDGAPMVPIVDFFCLVPDFVNIAGLPGFFDSYVTDDHECPFGAALTDICLGNEATTDCSFSEQSVFFEGDAAIWFAPVAVFGVSWDDLIGTKCPTTPAPSSESTCQESGVGLSTPHSCSCQASCDGSTYCNSLQFVEDRLGDAPADAQCPSSTQCCCSCPNCDNYEAPF